MPKFSADRSVLVSTRFIRRLLADNGPRSMGKMPPFSAGHEASAKHPGVLSGWMSHNFEEGHNQWVVDDAPQQLRTRLATSENAGQLAFGHLIHQSPDSASRGAWRGSGFELRTDGWLVVRAGEGMLISAFDLYKDGLPRVHPQAWVAMIGAAFKAGVKEVKTSSAWRPQEGSIQHRTGLGLDVNYLDNTQLNRGELINKGPDTDNVSEEEKRLYREKWAADEAEKKAQDKVNELKSEQEALKVRKAKEPNKVSPIREMEIVKELKVANEKKDAAAKNKNKNKHKNKANEAWNTERDKHEPTKVKDFREALKRQNGVKDLFDPWFMNADVQHKPDLPNEYKSPNEKLHRHHLHITIDDPALPFKRPSKHCSGRPSPSACPY